MGEKELTVTIPAYNVGEALLSRNIQSLINTSGPDLLDIIIIDDGSTDDTGQAADKLSAAYPNAVRVVHKANGGYGSGVNAGIELATGKYFCVVDADDYVDSIGFSCLLKELRKCDSDLVLGDYAIVDSSGSVRKTLSQSNKLPRSIETDFEAIARLLDPFSSASFGVHTEYIKTSLLRESATRLHEHHFYTDREYSMYPLPLIKTVFYVNKQLRYYYLGREGQSADRRTQIKNYTQATDVTGYLRDFYYKNFDFFSTHPNTEYFYLRIAAHHDRMCYAMQLSNTDVKSGKKLIMQHDSFVKDSWPELYKANPDPSVKLLRTSNFALYNLAHVAYQIMYLR